MKLNKLLAIAIFITINMFSSITFAKDVEKCTHMCIQAYEVSEAMCRMRQEDEYEKCFDLVSQAFMKCLQRCGLY